jgi:hypothetical protein
VKIVARHPDRPLNPVWTDIRSNCGPVLAEFEDSLVVSMVAQDRYSGRFMTVEVCSQKSDWIEVFSDEEE